MTRKFRFVFSLERIFRTPRPGAGEGHTLSSFVSFACFVDPIQQLSIDESYRPKHGVVWTQYVENSRLPFAPRESSIGPQLVTIGFSLFFVTCRLFHG